MAGNPSEVGLHLALNCMRGSKPLITEQESERETDRERKEERRELDLILPDPAYRWS